MIYKKNSILFRRIKNDIEGNNVKELQFVEEQKLSMKVHEIMKEYKNIRKYGYFIFYNLPV